MRLKRRYLLDVTLPREMGLDSLSLRPHLICQLCLFASPPPLFSLRVFRSYHEMGRREGRFRLCGYLLYYCGRRTEKALEKKEGEEVEWGK